MKIDAKRLRLYAVTDRAWASGTEGLLRQVAEAIDGGAGIVQLREKHLGQADFLAEAERFVALCQEKGAVSIINDDVEIAAQVGADGVHVGQEDLEAGGPAAGGGPAGRPHPAGTRGGVVAGGGPGSPCHGVFRGIQRRLPL